MTQSEFNDLAAQGYNRIPLVLETFADLDTPLSVYLKLANQPYSYLLESVLGGERFGRYSVIGLPAKTRLEAYGNEIEIIGGADSKKISVNNVLDFIESYLADFNIAPHTDLPRFCGGLVGYFAYDTVRYIEPRLAGRARPDTLHTPDVLLLLSEELAVVDNLSGKLYLIIYLDPTLDNAYETGRKRLKELLSRLRQPLTIPIEKPTESGSAVCEFSEAEFIAAVERAKHYIVEGDIMQVVLSQRTSKPYSASPLALYRALRSLNPSPYMFYYHLEHFHIVGASPEILVRLENDTVTVRPIAGTRPRGKNLQEDSALAADLLADPKERAEHVMLMDLGRNDIGRVAQIGTVNVTENMQIEHYSHVMHIVSNVEGKLKPGLNAIDVLRATFPAGTVSGAPKVRAMEIIDELEISKRGIYAGAVGYLGFNGDMDLAIAIRTGIIKDGKLHVQAGAGIVADSVPQSEWVETQNKAKALLRAAEIAESGLDSQID
ncbi:MAG TPA: anthranilate synthase component I [Nitrosomonas nitrosa]|uniref:Anthranilate synthase component 1 n=1 Tax=Nitrosomonas nitrosa TaxID=52442 RepID=A0A1I4SF01_9PROT|nr:anthranilate synthase component I [Nitrosomonas nitrosa]PTQ93704.1 anthranilate synthase component I [Nitrosomonas nitrosa]SFM62900.1 anthranilate synthase, component I [Nitrosomonas nitrosa]HBZ30754.1 anthranilate synthase component I [Nitrosomonas nitrosa]HNP52255.1 anthranilate synthase component I [Nitrosomonas nitrosa]